MRKPIARNCELNECVDYVGNDHLIDRVFLFLDTIFLVSVSLENIKIQIDVNYG